MPRASCTPPDRRQRRGASGDLCLSRLHRLTDHSLVGWPRPGPPCPPGVFTAQHSLRCVCQPPSGPRGRREKLIWSLAHECKSLPANRLEVRLDQGAHRLGMPYPPWAYARRVTRAPVHQRGVSGPSRRLASAGHKFLVFRNLYLAWVSHWARQGLRPWYPPECVQARFVTTPRSAGICSLSGRSKGIAWETRMQRFAVIGRQL